MSRYPLGVVASSIFFSLFSVFVFTVSPAGAQGVCDTFTRGSREDLKCRTGRVIDANESIWIKFKQHVDSTCIDAGGRCEALSARLTAQVAMLAAVKIADTLEGSAKYSCLQTAVVAGFGGNASVGCIVLGVARELARGILEYAQFVDGDTDSWTIKGAYERAGRRSMESMTSAAACPRSTTTSPRLARTLPTCRRKCPPA